jgi:hypothetical protein
MSAVKAVVKPEFKINVTGKFYSVVKVSHLLYVAYEIEVLKGVVVSTKCLSRAPDQQHTAVGAATSEIWPASREQNIETVFPEAANAKAP